MSSGKVKLFISYSWSTRKDAVHKMADYLENEAGFQVWIDKNNMTDKPNILQAMAKGIEEAQVMLCFYGDAYEKSESCQKEIQLADNLKKQVVPILVQRGYKPATWLLMIFKANFRVEYFENSQFDSALTDILRIIGNLEIPIPIKSQHIPLPKPVLREDKLYFSYCRSVRANAIRKMAAYLKDKEGFQVWINTEDMSGKMGIDWSDVVLCFFSAAYEKSENCKSEILYAREKIGKIIIPIRVESGHEPANWLGLIFKGRLRKDFFDDNQFQDVVNYITENTN